VSPGVLSRDRILEKVQVYAIVIVFLMKRAPKRAVLRAHEAEIHRFEFRHSSLPTPVGLVRSH
jgi:hypothetical protein